MKRALLGTMWFIAFMLAGPARGQEAPRLDVVFLLDATGSMGDEIDAVKEKIQEMISQIAVGDPAPDVRFGIVAYRDRRDLVAQVRDLLAEPERLAEMGRRARARVLRQHLWDQRVEMLLGDARACQMVRS